MRNAAATRASTDIASRSRVTGTTALACALLATLAVGCSDAPASRDEVRSTHEPTPASPPSPPEPRTSTPSPEGDAEPGPRPITPTGVVHTIFVSTSTFTPATLTITEGDEVDLVWTEGRSRVESGFECRDDGMFDTGAHVPPETARLPILRVGLYPYFDESDCEQRGIIVVKPR
jgi:hypothetical protein